MLSKFREPVNGITHLGGAIAAAFGLFFLLTITANTGNEKILSVLVYGITLIILFSASTIYHSAKASAGTINALRKIDHSAIFLLIAGTYTPICINAFTGFFHWGLLAIIWSISLIGILAKFIYIDSPRWFSASIYVLMGWLCVFASGQLITLLTAQALIWLIIGGCLYTFGALIYSAKLFNFIPGIIGSHEIWHIFVLLGAAAHFVSVINIIIKS